VAFWGAGSKTSSLTCDKARRIAENVAKPQSGCVSPDPINAKHVSGVSSAAFVKRGGGVNEFLASGSLTACCDGVRDFHIGTVAAFQRGKSSDFYLSRNSFVSWKSSTDCKKLAKKNCPRTIRRQAS
jgi:hypothetical protein